jgi:hypothetical protein
VEDSPAPCVKAREENANADISTNTNTTKDPTTRLRISILPLDFEQDTKEPAIAGVAGNR